ncbi:MAG: type II secretion system F family protein [Armatimonadetes bacterium]|nr:type II secretion system F family protein [Armatimonadota bacterium]
MARYSYRVSDPRGSLATGVLEAPDRAGAARALQSQGMILLELEEMRETAPAASALPQDDPFLSAVEGGEDAAARRRMVWSRYERAVFLRQLAMMFSAGIHVVKALEVLAAQASGSRSRLRLAEMVEDLEKGSSLGMAMQMSCLFNILQVGTVRIAEETGRMAALLDLLARLEEHEVNLRRRVIAQLSYPAVVLGGVILAVAFLGHLMGGVLGQFAPEMSGGTLRWAAAALASPWFPVVVIAAPGLLAVGLSRLWRLPGARPAMERFLLRLPAIGALLRRMEAARLCRLLGILAASGVQPQRSLALCRSATSSPAARQALQNSRESLLEGATFSQALERGAFFGREVIQLTAAGEEAGRLSSQLMKVADYSEMEVERFLESATAALEPLLIGVLGTVVALVMLLTFGPIYGVLGRL